MPNRILNQHRLSTYMPVLAGGDLEYFSSLRGFVRGNGILVGLAWRRRYYTLARLWVGNRDPGWGPTCNFLDGLDRDRTKGLILLATRFGPACFLMDSDGRSYVE